MEMHPFTVIVIVLFTAASVLCAILLRPAGEGSATTSASASEVVDPRAAWGYPQRSVATLFGLLTDSTLFAQQCQVCTSVLRRGDALRKRFLARGGANLSLCNATVLEPTSKATCEAALHNVSLEVYQKLCQPPSKSAVVAPKIADEYQRCVGFVALSNATLLSLFGGTAEPRSTQEWSAACLPFCHPPATLLDTAYRAVARFLSSPVMQGVLGVMKELWGAVFLVSLVGALLGMTLQVRSSVAAAALQQQKLFMAAAAELRKQQQQMPKPPATASPSSSSNMHGVQSSNSNATAAGVGNVRKKR